MLKESCVKPATVAAISSLLIIGFWLRIHNLGSLSLIVDEGHQALAVNGILKHGYPLVPSGVAYLTIPVYQYFQYLAALIFGLNEFSLRLPGVLFNLASIPLIYLFGRSLFNSKVGLLSAFLMTFSVWEIEVSRYARGYAAFQFLYIVSLFVFYKGFLKGERLHQFLVVPVFLLTFLFHPLGATLIMTFCVPFFIDSYAPLKRWLVLLFAVLTAGGFFICVRTLRFLDSLFYTAPALQMTNTKSISLESIRRAIKANFHTPELSLLKQLYVQDNWLFLALCGALVATIALLLYRISKGKSDRVETLFVLPIIASCFVYQFGVALVLFCLYVLLVYRGIASLKSVPSVVLYVSAILTFLFWFSYATWSAVEDFSSSKYFWDYPKLYDYFLQWMFAAWPRFTVVTGGGLLLMGYLFFKDRTRGNYIFPILLCLLLPIFASSIYWPYYVPRYAFNLYPLFIVVFAFTLCALSAAVQKKLVTTPGKRLQRQRMAGPIVETFALVLLAVFLSQDVYPSQAWAISNRTYTSAKDPIKAAQSWETFHQDYKTPGLFVKAHMTDRDIVLVLGASHVPSIFYHYTGRVDYVLMMPHEMPENGLSGPVLGLNTKKGLIHYATGSVVLKDSFALQRLLSSPRRGRVWILADFQTAPHDTVRRLRPDHVFTGRDGRTSVYTIGLPSAGPETS